MLQRIFSNQYSSRLMIPSRQISYIKTCKILDLLKVNLGNVTNVLLNSLTVIFAVEDLLLGWVVKCNLKCISKWFQKYFECITAWYEHFIINSQCQKYTNTSYPQLFCKRMNSFDPGAIWVILLIYKLDNFDNKFLCNFRLSGFLNSWYFLASNHKNYL